MKKILIIGAIILGSIGFSTSALAAISEQQAKDIVKKEAPNGQITKFKLDSTQFTSYPKSLFSI